MASGIPTAIQDEIDYPTGDGKPIAETPILRQNLTDLIAMIEKHFAGRKDFYVSGNMFLYYQEGDPRKHVSPDVFYVDGIPHDRPRDAYKTWEEGGKGPDLVIELTSRSTRSEDEKKKHQLYRDVLKVREYFLFDPKGEYLKPPLKGYRLQGGAYLPIAMVEGRLPSEMLGLLLERDCSTLRLYDPETGRWIPSPAEAVVEAQAHASRAGLELRRAEQMAAQAVQEAHRAEQERLQAQSELKDSHDATQRALEENEKLRRELDELRRRQNGRA